MSLHKTPVDVRKTIKLNLKVKSIWEEITPLAKNEWICWIISAKKIETRERRIAIMQDKLLKGERRPCCWAGCLHR